MMSYINETDFVIENKKLVYPEIVADGLQLYYDAKGKRDTDYHRDTILDMSGNKNHGKLHNFAYEKNSGYKDGLVFDYIDDKLVRPTLDLQPDDFTFMLNGNIISFSPDGTVKRVQDGEVIESKGFNLVRNGNFIDGSKRWVSHQGAKIDIVGSKLKVSTSATPYSGVRQGINFDLNSGEVVYTSFNVRNPSNYNITLNAQNVAGTYYIEISPNFEGSVSAIQTSTRSSEALTYYISKENTDAEFYFFLDNVVLLNLTKIFGAGNEPTKEQMDEIIQRFGFIPNAQDLIDHIEYKGNDLGDMENIIDGLYKTEVLSGEEVYTDKADDSVVHVDVDGESVGGGSGKNLVELDLLEQQSTLRVKYPLGKLKPGIAYYVSFKNKDYTFWNGGGWVSEGPINDNIRSTGVVIRKGTGNSGAGEEYTVGELIKDGLFQIEEGSVATAYEPPSPTPDYPVEIHSLNDFDVVSSVGGRNLLLDSRYISYYSGTKVVYKGKMATKLEGPTSARYSIVKTSEDFIEGETYTYSVLVAFEGEKPDNIQLYLPPLFSYTNVEGLEDLEEGRYGRVYITRKAPRDDSVGTPHLHIRGGDSNVYFTEWKIEKGNKATSWTPAPEDITESDNHPLINKINLLLDEPLRSVGDVKDRLFRDSDGVWKIKRNVGEHTFDGTERWNLEQKFNQDEFIQIHNNGGVQNKKIYGDSEGISNRFVNIGGPVTLNGNGLTGFRAHTGYDVTRFRVSPQKLLGVPYSSDNSLIVNGWRDWLSNNNVTITYLLQSPTIETLPQELQDKLNNLSSFEGSNYVYTVLPNDNNYLSDNLKPTLHAKFLYNNWYKEDRVINNLMIYNRALTNGEMLQNYKTIKRRWGM